MCKWSREDAGEPHLAIPRGIEITWISFSATAKMPSGEQNAWCRPNTTNSAHWAGKHNLCTKSPQLTDTAAEKLTEVLSSSQENKGIQSEAPLRISTPNLSAHLPQSSLLLPNSPYLRALNTPLLSGYTAFPAFLQKVQWCTFFFLCQTSVSIRIGF